MKERKWAGSWVIARFCVHLRSEKSYGRPSQLPWSEPVPPGFQALEELVADTCPFSRTAEPPQGLAPPTPISCSTLASGQQPSGELRSPPGTRWGTSGVSPTRYPEPSLRLKTQPGEQVGPAALRTSHTACAEGPPLDNAEERVLGEWSVVWAPATVTGATVIQPVCSALPGLGILGLGAGEGSPHFMASGVHLSPLQIEGNNQMPYLPLLVAPKKGTRPPHTHHEEVAQPSWGCLTHDRTCPTFLYRLRSKVRTWPSAAHRRGASSLLSSQPRLAGCGSRGLHQWTGPPSCRLSGRINWGWGWGGSQTTLTCPPQQR